MELSVRAGSRREFLGFLAAGQVLTEKNKVALGGKAEEAIARAASLGRDYTRQYNNCTQAVIAALQDAIEFVPKSGDFFLAGSCLHGGATTTGNANCGGFTGAGIVIGGLCGPTREQASDPTTMKLSTALLQQVAAKFEETYGSVICKDVRRAKAKEKCEEVMARAAAWAAEVILKQFTKGGV